MMTNETPQPTDLNALFTPEVCERVMHTMAAPIREKIAAAFIAAFDEGCDVIAADGTSPAGQWVLDFFNREMTRLGWAAETRRIMRLNIRAVGMTIVRDTIAADLH